MSCSTSLKAAIQPGPPYCKEMIKQLIAARTSKSSLRPAAALLLWILKNAVEALDLHGA
jgi:hypothetical protein